MIGTLTFDYKYVIFSQTGDELECFNVVFFHFEKGALNLVSASQVSVGYII